MLEEKRICQQCNKIFEKPYNVSKKEWENNHKFCSRKCYSDSRLIEKICPNCKKKFKILMSYNDRIYCSYKCRGEYLKGDKHCNWKDENVTITSKHVWLINNFGSANRCENRENKIFDFECNNKSQRFAYALKHSCEYEKNINNFYQLCYSCHKRYDLKKGWKGSSTVFKKGHIPWTKGRKRPEMTGEKHPLFGKHQSPESLAKFRETLRIKKLNKIT